VAYQFITSQELFDGAVKHQFEQKIAGLLPKGGGSYRSHGGYRCAIGALIPDSHYRTCMEGVPVRYLSAKATMIPMYMDQGVAAIRAALFEANVNIHDERTVNLLSALQNVNDIFGTWEWKARFTSIAQEFALNVDVLSQY
jgi:hypothetical protein